MEPGTESMSTEFGEAVAQVAGQYASRVGCHPEEAWDDIWNIIQDMRDAGIMVEIAAPGTSTQTIQETPEMRQDFDMLSDGDRIVLHPNNSNPLHKQSVAATYAGGYFYCDGTPPEEGPDYYLGDVLTYNKGFETVAQR